MWTQAIPAMARRERLRKKPSTGTLLVDVDWGTATGTTDNALRDGTKAYAIDTVGAGNPDKVLEVVTASSRSITGLSTTNILSIRQNGYWGHVKFNDWARPVGGEFWGYIFETLNPTNQLDIEQHPHVIAPNGDIHLGFLSIYSTTGGGGGSSLSGGDWNPGLRRLYFSHMGSTQVNALCKPGGSLLTVPGGSGAAAKIWARGIIEWIDSTTYRFYPQVLDSNGTVLADASDFELIDQSGATLQEWYDLGRVLQRNPAYSSLDRVREFSVGKAQAKTGNEYFYVGRMQLWYRTSASDFPPVPS